MLEPENHFVHVRGLRLRYVDWGNPAASALAEGGLREENRTLLMLHGDMRTSRSWDATARHLHDSYRVLALDQRGHGDSDWPERGYRYDDRIEDLAAFCNRLDLKGIVGMGHSSGGAVVTLAAQRYPELFNCLVLLEPVVVMTDTFQRRISGRASAPRRTWKSRDELRQHLKRHSLAGRWRDDVIEDVVRHEAMELLDGSIDMKWATATMSWAEREGDYFDLRPIFRSLGLPVLLILSSEREAAYADLRPMIDELPCFRMVTIPNTGHNMYMERPDAVAGAIKAFLEGSLTTENTEEEYISEEE